MKLLHLDASILGGNSVSRDLSASIVARLKATHPDLAAHSIPHLSGANLVAARGGPDQREDAMTAPREPIAALAAA